MSELNRTEDILNSIINDYEYSSLPQSRVEKLLIDIGELIKSGGATAEQIAYAVNNYLNQNPVSADLIKINETPTINTKLLFTTTSDKVTLLTSEDIDDKMEFYKVTLEETPNMHFEHNGETLTFQQLADKYRDEKYFLYCEYRSITFIPSLPPDYDPAYASEVLEFTAVWNYMDKHRISIIKINSDGEIKADSPTTDFIVASETSVNELKTKLSNIEHNGILSAGTALKIGNTTLTEDQLKILIDMLS